MSDTVDEKNTSEQTQTQTQPQTQQPALAQPSSSNDTQPPQTESSVPKAQQANSTSASDPAPPPAAVPSDTNTSSSSSSTTSKPPVDKDKATTIDKKKDSKLASSTGNLPTSFEKMKISEKGKSSQLLPCDRVTIKANGVSYTTERVVGNGSFGVVFQAVVNNSGETVAIKKVLQDKRFKNRELQIMKLINHPNVVMLKNSFYTNGEKPDEVYLNLVLEYVPETVYRVARQYSKLKQPIPLVYVKLYMYQLCRALGYIHSHGICHRDIKPQNLLLDPQSGILKLCDFGSAKILVKGEPNVSYICSRYYRAPELIFGSTNYTTAIDVWSMGCVLAELLLGQPLFPGDSGVDQLVEIIKVLGTPTREQIQAMNQNYTEFKFPQIKPHPWNRVFRSRTPPEAIDLVSRLLQYTPSSRISPFEACGHVFFDELRNPGTTLPPNRPLPPLFNFSVEELAAAKLQGVELLTQRTEDIPISTEVTAVGVTAEAGSSTGSLPPAPSDIQNESSQENESESSSSSSSDL